MKDIMKDHVTNTQFYLPNSALDIAAIVQGKGVRYGDIIGLDI